MTHLEAALNKEVAKAVDHEWVGLSNNRLNNLVLLLNSAHFELLLQENRSLLVIVANDFVNNIFPVASHGAIEETTVIERLHR